MLERVLAVGETLRGTTRYTGDLSITIEEESEFRESLGDTRFRGFHATRLLDHERERIRLDGLRALSRQLTEERVDLARDVGAITDEEHAALRTANVFAERDETAAARAGSVCLVFGRSALDDDVAGLWGPLTTWGGEGIYMSAGAAAWRPRLERLGLPSIVVADLVVTGSWRDHRVWPGILKALTGRVLGLRRGGCEVHHRGDVGPGAIVDIWQPGHPEYSRHLDLPSVREAVSPPCEN